MSAYIVGLTGGIGSGKTTVTDLFAAQGITIVDTDVIAHRLTAPGGLAMPAILAEFGAGLATPEGALNRPAMRQLVFADPAARLRLEAILHPLIRQQTAAECAAASSPYVVVAVPLLIESGGWRERFDRILVIDCSPELQIRRVMARSQLTAAEVEAILAAQVSREQRLAAADDVLDNSGDVQNLAAGIARIHAHYLTLAAAKKLQANC